MSWVAVIGAGASIASSAIQSNGAKKSANAVIGAANQANDKLTSIYDESKGNYNSYLDLGNQANTGLSSLLSGDYSGFYNSPDYQSAMQSGTQALDRSAAARGGLYSGGHSADLTAFGQNTANQYLGNYRNFLSGMSSQGLNAVNGVANLGTQYGQQYSNNLMTAAQAAANGASQKAGIGSNLVGNLGSIGSSFF